MELKDVTGSIHESMARNAMLNRPVQMRDVYRQTRTNSIKFLDLRFIDMPGMWQHFTVPISELDNESAVSGFGFDGSSIRGFQEINESDMLLIPDFSTAFIDPFAGNTLSVIANVKDPETKQWYSRDPRFVARKAEEYLRKTKLADVSYFGPELEFFIFDSIRYDQKENCGYYFIESEEGIWNSGAEGENGKNLGYKPRYKEGYFPTAPNDSMVNIRNEIVTLLIKAGIRVEAHHHEVATAGQMEIDMRFNSLTRMADNVMIYKYFIKNVARKHNKTATFMPKPLFNDNGSGMHVHQSLWKAGKNQFFGNKYAGLSDMAMHYAAGLLEHAPALCALIAPTTNSYKRLVPGFEAPVNLVYSKRNRSAAVRVPMYFNNPKAKRIEFRTPDPSANPYLAFSAMLMAGMDGVKRKLDPGESTDENLYEMSPEKAKKVKNVPSSLSESLDALEDDHKFLLQGGVFTKDLIETWISYKRSKEVDAVRLRPHPWEYHLYFDI